MSPLATLILAWAAVYACVCIYHCAVYGMSRGRHVHITFGLLAGTFAVYAVGAALLADAETQAEGATALGIKIAGLTPGMALAVAFAHDLAGKRSRVTTIAVVWAGLGLVLAASGGFMDGAHASPPPTWGFLAAPDYAEPSVTTAGMAYMAVSWALVAYAVPLLAPLARRRRDTALILASFAVNLLAGANDILIQIGSLQSVYLLEHSVLLSVIVMSSMLLDRFVHTSEQLATRTRQLKASYEEQQSAEAEIMQKEHLAAVGELSALVALEVRAPLTDLRERANALGDGGANGEPAAGLLDSLDAAVEHLNRLVSSFVSFAKPADPNAARPTLEDLVRRAIGAALGPGAAAKPFTVNVHLHDPAVSLNGDPDLLEHAVATILRHAGRSALHRPVVLRSERVELDGLRAVALACGPGPEATGPTLPDSAPGASVPRGDVGVALVDRVLRMHGGMLTVEQPEDGERRVTLTIPEAPSTPSEDPVWNAGGGI